MSTGQHHDEGLRRAVSAARQGSDHGVEWLWNRWARAVVAFGRVHGLDDPEGVARVAFDRVLVQLPEPGEEQRFARCLFGVVRVRIAEVEADRPLRIEAGAISRDTAAALRRLEDIDRELILLRAIAGLSRTDAAHVLGIDVDDVGPREAAALQSVRNHILEPT